MNVEHVLTRSVRDSAAVLDASSGPERGAPYSAPEPVRPFLDEVGADPGRLRIAYASRPFLPGTVRDDVLVGLERAVELCGALGHELTEATPAIDGEAFASAFFTMVCGETAAEIHQAEQLVGRKATSKDFEASTWAVALLGRQLSAGQFSSAIRMLKNTARHVGEFFQDYDVLLTPTLARPPIRTGELQPKGAEAVAMKSLGRLNAGGLISAMADIDAMAEQVFEFMPYTPVFNATGQPAMSVPLHWNDEGLPIGMHFVARYGDEATLFRLAAQLEHAAPWADRRPPVSG
jgi:amidase